MSRFVITKKYMRLDLGVEKDRAKYASLCTCPGIEIIKEKDVYIPPQKAELDKFGNVVVEPIEAKFIKDIIYGIKERSLVPNEFK